MLWIQKNYGTIAFVIQFVGQPEYVLWTRVAAEFTPFAALEVDDDSSLSHKSIPPSSY